MALEPSRRILQATVASWLRAHIEPVATGHRLVNQDGTVSSVDEPVISGATSGPVPAVGGAATGSREGYWVADAHGGVFSHGDASFYGSEGAARLNKPIVGMATTPDGAPWRRSWALGQRPRRRASDTGRWPDR